MKVYKVTLKIIDFDQMGCDGIINEIENTKYANYCIDPKVIKVEGADIGEWSDEHPLNKTGTNKESFNKYMDNAQIEFEW